MATDPCLLAWGPAAPEPAAGSRGRQAHPPCGRALCGPVGLCLTAALSRPPSWGVLDPNHEEDRMSRPHHSTETTAPRELGRYRISGGERVVLGQRVLGVVRLSDVPADGRGRRYLISAA
jgi:hypothetical protein